MRGADAVPCSWPEGFPAFEVAYTLRPQGWGKGYAREGAAAALRFARETLAHPAIASIICLGSGTDTALLITDDRA